MASTTFIIKRHDTLPILTAVLKDSSDVVLNLENTTVLFTMKDISTGDIKIDTQPCTIVSASSGIISYSWVATDTDTAGEYLGEFEIEYETGKMTVPTEDALAIVILEDYNNK
jgi:hypothetical protein